MLEIKEHIGAIMTALSACMLLSVQPSFAGAFDVEASGNSVSGASQKSFNQSADKPLDSKGYFMRGTKESNDKDYQSAVQDLTEAIRMNPHYGEALGNRGSAKFNLHDYNGALSDFNAALQIFPENKALLDLKAKTEGAISEQSQAANNEANRQAAIVNQIRNQALLGGDFSDPSTMIMMNAQRRGLIPAGSGDLSDPANIIMNNARRRGLIPANTPNP